MRSLILCFFLFMLCSCGKSGSSSGETQVFVASYKKDVATGNAIPFSGLALQVNNKVVSISSEDSNICIGTEVFYSSQNFTFSVSSLETWVGNAPEIPDCFPQQIEIKNQRVLVNGEWFYEVEILAEIYYIKIQ